MNEIKIVDVASKLDDLAIKEVKMTFEEGIQFFITETYSLTELLKNHFDEIIDVEVIRDEGNRETDIVFYFETKISVIYSIYGGDEIDWS